MNTALECRRHRGCGCVVMIALMVAIGSLGCWADYDNVDPSMDPQHPEHEGRIIDNFRDKHPLPLDKDGHPEGRAKHQIKRAKGFLGEVVDNAFSDIVAAFFESIFGPFEFGGVLAFVVVILQFGCVATFLAMLFGAVWAVRRLFTPKATDP